MQWNPYLSFNGNCREAFAYYAQHLGGQVVATITYGEMGGGQDMPAEMRDIVVHARLVAGDQVLMGGDTPPPHQYEGVKGCCVAIQLAAPADVDRLFAAFSEGGSVQMPPGETEWATRFAMCTDKFGVPWILNCEKQHEQPV